jgi:hypothetical protein
MVELTDSEKKILLKINDICILSLKEHVSVKLLYNILSKDYLWITIRELERKGLIASYKEYNFKMIYLTRNGVRVTDALALIRSV